MGANKSLEGMCIANKNINSLVIDRLSDRIDEDNVPVVYLYCNFQAQKSQVTAHARHSPQSSSGWVEIYFSGD